MILKCMFLICILQYTYADTPANCSFEDTLGKWNIFIGPFNSPCDNKKLILKKTFTLIYPNFVTDEYGNSGRWTLIYNQGFEVKINNMKYFGYFDYKRIDKNHAISYCHRLQTSWYHDVLIRQWGCFRAQKDHEINRHESFNFDNTNIMALKSMIYGTQKDLVTIINTYNYGWIAEDYQEFHNKSYYDIIKMSGGLMSHFNRPKTAKVTKLQLDSVKLLPESFDWRDFNGINYVSPVRHQDGCGSCYAFASAGMLEARYRIISNNTITPIFSPQDIVECSPYSQGCDGGFPYLIGGKYAEDFGMVRETCNPYKGKNGICSTNKNCKRYYATNYKYIGGFYGASNEPRMMMELIKNGPIAVSFEVYHDFKSYRGGVYHHIYQSEKLIINLDKIMHRKIAYNPFQKTNHVVVIVGYGKTKDEQKYWIVKNSWGDSWGEKGYFRIRRGNDECGIESISVSSEPII